MAREKEGYRDHYAELNLLFPGRLAISGNEFADAMGKALCTLYRWGAPIRNGTITKQAAARWLCDLDEQGKKVRAV